MNKLTICICYYNSEKYIQDCINSIDKYLDNNADVLFVNDGSFDSSRLIVENYISKKPNENIININHEINCGLPIARATAIKNCKTEWLFFLDSDDLLYDNLFKYFNSMQFDSEIDIVQFEAIDGDGKYRENIEEIVVKNGKSFLREFFQFKHSLVSLQIKVFRRFLFDPSPFYSNISHFDDNMSTPIILSRANKIYFTNKIFLKIIWISNSVSRSLNSLNNFEKRIIYSKYYLNHFLHLDNNLPVSVKDDFYLRYQVETILKFSYYSSSLGFSLFNKELKILLLKLDKNCFLKFKFCFSLDSKSRLIVSLIGVRFLSYLLYFMGKLNEI